MYQIGNTFAINKKKRKIKKKIHVSLIPFKAKLIFVTVSSGCTTIQIPTIQVLKKKSERPQIKKLCILVENKKYICRSYSYLQAIFFKKLYNV